MRKWNNNGLSDDLRVEINTDSELVMKTVQSWIPEWRARGWRRANGRSIANEDLVHELDQLQRQIQVVGANKSNRKGKGKQFIYRYRDM